MASARPFLPEGAGPAPSILLPAWLRSPGKLEIPGKAGDPWESRCACEPRPPGSFLQGWGHLGEPGPSPAALGRSQDVVVIQEILNKPGAKHGTEPRHRMTPAGSAGTPGQCREQPGQGHGHTSAVPRCHCPLKAGTRGAGPLSPGPGVFPDPAGRAHLPWKSLRGFPGGAGQPQPIPALQQLLQPFPEELDETEREEKGNFHGELRQRSLFGTSPVPPLTPQVTEGVSSAPQDHWSGQSQGKAPLQAGTRLPHP